MSRLSLKKLLVVSASFLIALVVFPAGWDGPFLRSAEAIIGRPLTPVSYAGVARRTSRRTTRRVVAGSAVAYGAVSTLPAGCALTGSMYACGGMNYRVAYDGPDVVYVPVDD